MAHTGNGSCHHNGHEQITRDDRAQDKSWTILVMAGVVVCGNAHVFDLIYTASRGLLQYSPPRILSRAGSKLTSEP